MGESVLSVIETSRTFLRWRGPRAANTTQVGKLARGAVISPKLPVRMGSLVKRQVSGGGQKDNDEQMVNIGMYCFKVSKIGSDVKL